MTRSAPVCGLSALLVLFSLTGCDLLKDMTLSQDTGTTPEFDQMESHQIKIMRADGTIFEALSKIADEPEEQAAGFQFIGPDIIKKSLILFIFGEPIRGLFHMRNVRAPLDIAFISSDGRFIKILQMKPGNELYGVDEPFQFAVEAGSGYFEENNIKAAGSRLLLSSFGETNR